MSRLVPCRPTDSVDAIVYLEERIHGQKNKNKKERGDRGREEEGERENRF